MDAHQACHSQFGGPDSTCSTAFRSGPQEFARIGAQQITIVCWHVTSALLAGVMTHAQTKHTL
jgi:hypothetical protein